MPKILLNIRLAKNKPDWSTSIEWKISAWTFYGGFYTCGSLWLPYDLGRVRGHTDWWNVFGYDERVYRYSSANEIKETLHATLDKNCDASTQYMSGKGRRDVQMGLK